MQYVMLIVGFIMLIKGADLFVDGSSGLAKRLHVPTMAIGLTVVAMGTSLPEAAVSVSAAVQGRNDMALSNALGSNMFNILAVVGVCAMIAPISIKKSTLLYEFPMSVIVVGVLLAMGLIGNSVDRIDGIILIGLFLVFMFYTVTAAKRSRISESAEPVTRRIMPGGQCAFLIIFGAAAIGFGGYFTVDSAARIARSFGISENVIGLTIVAVGTSLPELFTSIVAAKKRETDLALGNVIGSNIFNILFVLGSASVISPISFLRNNMIDSIALIAMSILTVCFCAEKRRLRRWEGAAMAAVYIGYIIYITVRA